MGNFSYICFWPLVPYQNASFSLGLIPGDLVEQISHLSEQEQPSQLLTVIAPGVSCPETAPEHTLVL